MSDIGFRRFLGIQYREKNDRRAVVVLPIDEDKRNIRGVAHGGVVASLIDIAMGTAASGGDYQTRSRLVVTLEMKVNYLAPAVGAELTATAEVLHLGRRTIVVRCEVLTDTGKICAIGLGTFITRPPHENDPDHLRSDAVGRKFKARRNRSAPSS